MLLERAFTAYEHRNKEAMAQRASLADCLSEFLSGRPVGQAQQVLELNPKSASKITDNMAFIEATVQAHPHILGVPEAKLRAMRALSSGGTLRSEADIVLAYQIAAMNSLRGAAADLNLEKSDFQAATLAFLAQGLEAYRATILIECLRIKRLYYRAKRPGLSGVLKRGEDLSPRDLETLLSKDNSERLRQAQAFTLALMRFNRPELAEVSIVGLFDFITSCHELYQYAAKADQSKNDPERRADFYAFVNENFQMPLEYSQLPRIRRAENGQADNLKIYFTLDSPLGDQNQRPIFVKDELLSSLHKIL